MTSTTTLGTGYVSAVQAPTRLPPCPARLLGREPAVAVIAGPVGPRGPAGARGATGAPGPGAAGGPSVTYFTNLTPAGTISLQDGASVPFEAMSSVGSSNITSVTPTQFRVDTAGTYMVQAYVAAATVLDIYLQPGSGPGETLVRASSAGNGTQAVVTASCVEGSTLSVVVRQGTTLACVVPGAVFATVAILSIVKLSS